MASQIATGLLTKQIFGLLQETFEKVEGIYLDGGTSLAETLATVSAQQASLPAVEGGSTIAAHVQHMRFYLTILNDYMDGKWQEKIDWKQSWLLKSVTESEWDTLRQGLRDDYESLKAHLQGFADWNDERRIGGAIAIVAHTAFQLGAVRQIALMVRGKSQTG